MGPGEEVSTRYLSEDAIVSSGCVDMQQHYVTLYDGSQDAKEQVVNKVSRLGHLGQILSGRHIRDEVLEHVLSEHVPHLFQHHLPGKHNCFYCQQLKSTRIKTSAKLSHCPGWRNLNV